MATQDISSMERRARTEPVGFASHEEVLATFRHFIVSASGWRSIFSASESDPERTTAATDNIVAVAAYAFSEFLAERSESGSERALSVLVARDTRPTGPRITEIAARVLIAWGFEVRYAGVVATPELLAYVRDTDEVDAFFLSTASHNPIEYNGIKLGLGDGAVLAPEQATLLGTRFKELVEDAASVEQARELANRVSAERLDAVLRTAEERKRAVYEAYRGAVTRSYTGIPEGEAQAAIWDRLGKRIRESAPGVLVDYNGGARTLSVDRDVMKELGIRLVEMNADPGAVAHEIVPEGEGLEPCVSRLAELHAKDAGYTLGYVTDNDGDRGNIVIYDERSGEIRSIHAQELFALVCMIELAWMVHTGRITYDERGRCLQKVAVVANGPTSLRVDRIAAAFDATVFRAEVGEANVVALARVLRRRGYLVRMLGEGSNGGSIIEPAEVRDPLATLGALLKLLFTPTLETSPERDLFAIWCARSGNREAYRSDYGIGTVLATLPPFRTTSTAESRARVEIGSADRGELKREYSRLLPEAFESLKSRVGQRLPIYRWDIVQNIGTDEVRGADKQSRADGAQGGFKLLLKNEIGRPIGFAWMRASGTEPIFRVLADTEGADQETERILLQWHSDLVQRAARNVTGAVAAR